MQQLQLYKELVAYTDDADVLTAVGELLTCPGSSIQTASGSALIQLAAEDTDLGRVFDIASVLASAGVAYTEVNSVNLEVGHE